MYQKQEIVIDRRSQEAMNFLTGEVFPYIQAVCNYYAEEPYMVHYFYHHTASKPVCEIVSRYIDLKKKIVSSGHNITVTLEEEWETMYKTYNMFIPCETFPEGVEPRGEDDDDEEEYLDSLYGDYRFIMSKQLDEDDEDSTSEAEEPDYHTLENAFLENEDSLKGVCSLKIVRGFDPTERNGAFVQVWDSNNHKRIIRASNDCARSDYSRMFYHLDTGRAVKADELPERQWFGVEPAIEIYRLNGLKKKEGQIRFDIDDPYINAEPISEDIAGRFKETPDYVSLAEKAIDSRILIDKCNNGPVDSRPDLWCDTLSVFDKRENLSTAELIGYIYELEKLADNINADNDSLLTELGLENETLLNFFVMFYTKDFDILEVYYDHSERKLKCDLYESGSDKNGVIKF